MKDWQYWVMATVISIRSAIAPIRTGEDLLTSCP